MKKLNISICFIFFCLILSISCFCQGFTKVNTYSGSFKDADNNALYSEGIKDVYELGIMDGISDDYFGINEQMTVSHAVTVAARLHSIYNSKTITDVSNSNNWFDKYVLYCENNGIISRNKFNDYSRPILSYEAVCMFSAALPHDFYKKINDVKGILDVPDNIFFAQDVLGFYNAGILCGNDDYGTFLPTEKLTRARAATIISRICFPQKRLTFSLLPQLPEYDIDTVFNIFSYHTKQNTLDKIKLITIDGIEISGAMYRYYSYIGNGSSKKILEKAKEYAGIVQMTKDEGLKITRTQLCAMLSSYYNAKTAQYSSGTFDNVLEGNRLSDEAFAKISVANALVPLLRTHIGASITQNDEKSVDSAYTSKLKALINSFDISYASNFENLAAVID